MFRVRRADAPWGVGERVFLGSMVKVMTVAVGWVAGMGCGIFMALFLSSNRVRGDRSASSSAVRVSRGAESPYENGEFAREWGAEVPLDLQKILDADPVVASRDDCAAVLRFLQGFAAASQGALKNDSSEEDVRWILDAVLSWLRRGRGDTDSLARACLDLAGDRKMRSVVKETALVHLGLCVVGEPLRTQVGCRLAELATNSADAPWVGVAFALLGRECFSAPHPEWVRERCAEMAADSHAHVFCRITAFDLAARRGWQEVEPVARMQAVSSASVAEKVAALHALAETGNEDTRLWLEKQEVPQDRFVAACINAARARLLERGPKY